MFLLFDHNDIWYRSRHMATKDNKKNDSTQPDVEIMHWTLGCCKRGECCYSSVLLLTSGILILSNIDIFKGVLHVHVTSKHDNSEHT